MPDKGPEATEDLFQLPLWLLGFPWDPPGLGWCGHPAQAGIAHPRPYHWPAPLPPADRHPH